MPKDTLVSSESGAQKKGEKPLKRGEACLRCRKRRVRCDAVAPTCGSCEASWRNSVRCLKPGLEPPPYPQCSFEPASSLKAGIPGGSIQQRGKVGELETRIGDLEALLGRVGGVESFISATGRSSQVVGPQDLGWGTYEPSANLPSSLASSSASSTSSSNPDPPSTNHTSLSRSDSLDSQPGSYNSYDPVPWRQQAQAQATSSFPPSFDSPPILLSSRDHQLPAEAIIPKEDFPFIMQLLWPGWPSHLPPPGKLEHVVETFFSVVPNSTELLNKPRFLARLALPPMSKDFPHPALLHAICAVTARYLPVELASVDLFPSAPFPPRNNEVKDQPTSLWNGFGLKPSTAEAEEDFGRIHFRWANLYINQAKENPDQWMQVCQASIFLYHYCHQLSDWVQGVSQLALSGRLVVPLGLNSRSCEVGGISSSYRLTFLKESTDEIEQRERSNLAWVLFVQDTFSATASGWQGVLDPKELYQALPTTPSTFGTGLPRLSATQFADDDDADLFSRNPSPHSSSFALSIKGAILLRKMTDYIRKADMRGEAHPRETPEFRRLDRLITSFRSSFPPDLSDPLRFVASGKAVDRNLVLAQALPFSAFITLHDRYTNAHDPHDPSAARVVEAARSLLRQVYLLISTNFDISLLHPFMTTQWFLASKTLMKELQACLLRKDDTAVTTLLSEIEVFGNALGRAAQRFPVAARQKLLQERILVDVLTDPSNPDVFPGYTCGATLNSLTFPPATILSSPDSRSRSFDTSGVVESSAFLLDSLAPSPLSGSNLDEVAGTYGGEGLDGLREEIGERTRR